MSYHERSRERDKRHNRWDHGPDKPRRPSQPIPLSRGVHREQQQQHHHVSDSTNAVTDEQALEALLHSANQNYQKKQDVNHPHPRKRTTTSGPSKYQQNSNNEYYPPQNRKEHESFKRHKKISRKEEEEKMDSHYTFGKPETEDTEQDAPPLPPGEKIKANFGLSGALANDDQTGNVQNGITLKFSEPPEARIPNTRWRLYVFKKNRGSSSSSTTTTTTTSNHEESTLLDTLHISKQSSYLFGRERQIADIPVDHPSLSKQHCVLQYRALVDKADGKLKCKPYLMDLGSTNGTFINGVRLEDARYYELRKGDVITLGASSREYVLLTENTTSADL
jgi:smad nuclear-interacting protein 1